MAEQHDKKKMGETGRRSGEMGERESFGEGSNVAGQGRPGGNVGGGQSSGGNVGQGGGMGESGREGENKPGQQNPERRRPQDNK